MLLPGEQHSAATPQHQESELPCRPSRTASPLKDQYAARVATDLEANTQEQARIREQLQAVQIRLAALESDHALLVCVHGTLNGESAALAPSAAPVPEGSGGPASANAAAPVPLARATRSGSTAGTGRRKRAAAGSQAVPTGQGSAPTLRELVKQVFARHEEPRTVREVLTELATAHPHRTEQGSQVVRNTLEALVAQGFLDRERKQGSVSNAVRSNAPSTDAVEADTTAAPAEATPSKAAGTARSPNPPRHTQGWCRCRRAPVVPGALTAWHRHHGRGGAHRRRMFSACVPFCPWVTSNSTASPSASSRTRTRRCWSSARRRPVPRRPAR
ncbi:hypothetical protein GCM10012280_64380 [Wenjunlia tyrosinilytica]|uniref:Uncharacterized protein n=1 Tax=Wenjunlia tyrosinilytica TaxID=1544741 RepID=A0A918E1W2_9ACTN|nr:hypothetical protein GCM10012280_64380 [Wenjunlia tyrosinilytica]